MEAPTVDKSSQTLSWHVVCTKPRSEKAVAEKLEKIGVEVYCPCVKSRRKWSDRWKWIEEPLFKSYCFVRVHESNRRLVFSTKGVVRYLHWLGSPAIIREQEMDKLKLWLSDFDREQQDNKLFIDHGRAKVESGLLTGREVEIVSRQGSAMKVKLDESGLFFIIDLEKTKVESIGTTRVA